MNNRGRQDQDSGNQVLGEAQHVIQVSQVGSQSSSLTRDQTRIHSSLDTFSSISGCSMFTAVRNLMADKLPVGQRSSEAGLF